MGKDTVMVHERLAIVGVGELFCSSVVVPTRSGGTNVDW